MPEWDLHVFKNPWLNIHEIHSLKQWIPFHLLCWYKGAKNYIWANTFIGSWVTGMLLPSRVVALSTTLTFPSNMPSMLGLGDWKFICGGIVPCLAIRTHFTKLANPANQKIYHYLFRNEHSLFSVFSLLNNLLDIYLLWPHCDPYWLWQIQSAMVSVCFCIRPRKYQLLPLDLLPINN